MVNTAYVIAPEPGEVINKQTSLVSLLRNNLLASALIFAALECWRPYFFLTDDNLDGAFPMFTEIGHDLLNGRSPFISNHIFGGGYNMLHDPAFFTWHPLYLAASLLAGTPFHNAIIDVDAFVLFMLATAGFVVLADYLRREMALTISDGWIMFYTLSFTYTMVALTTGASWLMFMGNYSALPWLVWGILQTKLRRGLCIVTLFLLHQILGGHLLPTVSNSVFLSFFALGMSISRRSLIPLANWLVSYAIAVVILLPLLIPIVEGFSDSYRAGGVTLDDMQSNNVPALQFQNSVFAGMALWLLHPHQHPYTTYTLALGASAAAWCLIPALTPEIALRTTQLGYLLYRMKYTSTSLIEALRQMDIRRAADQKWNDVDKVALALMLFGAVLISRPVWITEIMLHLPIFRSMRWPFREFVQFQFFLHLFLVVRPPGLTIRLRQYSAVLGTCIMVIPMLLFPLPPTFNSMTWDRELVLTGGYERYWSQVRPLLKPTDRIAVLIPLDLYLDNRYEEPYSLLGTYDYAVLADVVNAWGYSPTAPRSQLYTRTYAYYPFGAYHPFQKEALMAERPDLKFITLESLHPLKITLSSRDGPTIDLTPFVPKRISQPLTQHAPY